MNKTRTKTKTKKIAKRYVSVSYRGVKGIRKDLKYGSFLVEKKIDGVRHTATFDVLRDAAEWKRNFHPGLNFKTPKDSHKTKMAKSFSKSRLRQSRHCTLKNGNDLGYTFAEVWELYVERHLSQLEQSSSSRVIQSAQSFFGEIMSVPMVEFGSEMVSDYLADRKNQVLRQKNERRYNFDQELKRLKALFNWYRENIDSMFVNPVLKRHRKEGNVKPLPRRKKKMRRHELNAFFDALGADDIFWRDLAEVQFYFSGRVQEVAGLQWQNVDFTDAEIEIEHVAIWDSPDRNFAYLKDCPKNGENRMVPMTRRLYEILQRRLKERRPVKITDSRTGKKVAADFVFHADGQPLRYRTIQYRYNRALKRIGIGDRFGSTHILRHSMANLVRERMGLDHAQAVGGWKTRALVENVYTEQPAHLTKSALENIEHFMQEERDSKTCKTGNHLRLVENGR